MRRHAHRAIALAATLLLGGALSGCAAAPAASAPPAFRVVDGRFVVTLAKGVERRSEQLIGATFDIDDGAGGTQQIRIDSVAAAKDRPSVLLHQVSVRNAAGGWSQMCDADAQGRRAVIPVRGRWQDDRFVADPNAWFLTCSSGSRGKCILWGYDPWAKAPGGTPLADHYRACQQMVRADYAGNGAPHTREGTEIDVADRIGVTHHDTLEDRAFTFEAGWAVDGAVCVARTRWPDLATRDQLVRDHPRLGGRCDPDSAAARHALLFTRVRIR